MSSYEYASSLAYSSLYLECIGRVCKYRAFRHFHVPNSAFSGRPLDGTTISVSDSCSPYIQRFVTFPWSVQSLIISVLRQLNLLHSIGMLSNIKNLVLPFNHTLLGRKHSVIAVTRTRNKNEVVSNILYIQGPIQLHRSTPPETLTLYLQLIFSLAVSPPVVAIEAVIATLSSDIIKSSFTMCEGVLEITYVVRHAVSTKSTLGFSFSSMVTMEL